MLGRYFFFYVLTDAFQYRVGFVQKRMVVGGAGVHIAQGHADFKVVLREEVVEGAFLYPVAFADYAFGAVAVHGVAQFSLGRDDKQLGGVFLFVADDLPADNEGEGEKAIALRKQIFDFLFATQSFRFVESVWHCRKTINVSRLRSQ